MQLFSVYRYVSLLCIAWLIIINLSSFSSKRILMLPFTNSSHSMILHSVTSSLAARGHSVTVLWATEFSQKSITRYPNYTLLEFSMGITSDKLVKNLQVVQDNFAYPLNFSFLPISMGWLTKIKSYFEIASSMSRLGESISIISNWMCKALLSDYHLMAKLKEQHFDMALVDDNLFARCLYLIPYSLGALLILYEVFTSTNQNFCTCTESKKYCKTNVDSF